MNGLALCAGVAGLDIGISLAEPDYRAVCYVEREAYAAAVLVTRMADGCLAPAPVWDDLESFDGRPWRGKIQVITSGFPCQPFSCAGKRRGLADERWLWPHIERIIRQVRPQIVFLENVPQIRNQALGLILSSLAALGFDAEWDLFSAAGSGAPHLRRRFFLLAAQPKRIGCRPWAWGDLERDPVQSVQRRPGPGKNSSAVEMANATKWQFMRRQRPQNDVTDKTGSQTSTDAIQRTWWAIEPPLGRVANGVAHRVDRLRACGNGVVPQVAARAWTVLKARLLGVG